MDQLKRILTALSVPQRWTIALVAVLVAGGLVAFERWQQESGFRPLYTSLAPEDAAAVVQKLKEESVLYHISADGSSISVPQERVPELRLEMAGAGLPKSGRIGFEIFDKSNFGMTDFAEHVNYRRALEGELERSVMAISQVEQARVHISFPQESVFTESRQPAKASVLLRIRAGARLPQSAVPAITHLVSSAVENLAPESVSVMDMRGELLNRPKRTGDRNEETSEAALEYQKRVEQSLTAKLDATLEPLIGAGRFRAAVSADCDMTSGEQSEESFDPTKSVMVSSQKTEDTSTSARVTAAGAAPGVVGGVPGTASNLPDAAPRPAGSPGGTSRTTENINYQTSRTVKRTVLPQGSIKRLSVSILLDQEVHMEGTGPTAKRIVTAPAPERLKVIHDLAAAAIGFDMGRGDQLIVESLPFESTVNFEPLDSNPAPPAPPNLWYTPLLEALKTPKNKAIAGGAAGGFVLVLAGLIFFMRKRGKQRRTRMEATHTPVLPAGSETGRAEAVAAREEAHPVIGSSPFGSLSAAEQPIAIEGIRETAMKDAEVSVGVLRGWLREGRT